MRALRLLGEQGTFFGAEASRAAASAALSAASAAFLIAISSGGPGICSARFDFRSGLDTATDDSDPLARTAAGRRSGIFVVEDSPLREAISVGDRRKTRAITNANAAAAKSTNVRNFDVREPLN